MTGAVPGLHPGTVEDRDPRPPEVDQRSTGLPGAARALLLATAALLPVKLGSGGPLAPSDLLLLASFAALFPRWPRLPERGRFPAVLLLAALTVAAFVTFFGGHAATTAWALVRLVGAALLLGYLAAFHLAFRRDPAFTDRVLRVLVTSTLLVNVALVPGSPLRPVLSSVFHQKWDSRLSGALFDPNANGAVLAVCLLLALFGPRRLFSGVTRVVVVGGLAFCLALTFSRGAALGAAAGLAWSGALVLRRHPERMLGVLCGLVAVAGMAVASGLPDRIDAHYESRPASSLDNRFVYVDQSVAAFRDRPLTGAGLGNGTSQAGAVTHATFFWLLGDAGIVAAAAYGWLLVAAFAAARRVVGAMGDAVVGAVVCLAVVSFSFESLYQRTMWVVMAVAFAGATAARERMAVAATVDVAGRPSVAASC